MKRLLIMAAVAATLATTASAGLFDSMVTSDWETKESDNYKLDAYGFDLRVYEWTPNGNPNMTCITAFGEKGSVGLQCFENEMKKEIMK